MADDTQLRKYIIYEPPYRGFKRSVAKAIDGMGVVHRTEGDYGQFVVSINGSNADAVIQKIRNVSNQNAVDVEVLNTPPTDKYLRRAQSSRELFTDIDAIHDSGHESSTITGTKTKYRQFKTKLPLKLKSMSVAFAFGWC